MIQQLKNNIYEYLNDKEIVVPVGYDKISDGYPFYYFLEDFIGANIGEIEEDDLLEYVEMLGCKCHPDYDFIRVKRR